MISNCDVIEAPAARPLKAAFSADVLAGLSQTPKSISSAWFYDERGSRLFQQITELEEYYLTACEREILSRHAGRLAERFRGDPLRIIEIGAGDGDKTEILLRSFVAAGIDFEFVPIDICRQAVVDLTARLRRKIDTGRFRVQGIVAEYADGVELLAGEASARNLVLFLGSSIGNFDVRQARGFLRALHRSLRPRDSILIGFDLKKDLEVLRRAYDDAEGVTRAFNFNLLARINRELGGQFEAGRFVHHAAYNVAESCMESWVVSREDHSVRIAALNRSFSFRAWEGMRLERSCKYDLADIESLAATSGFSIVEHLHDGRRYFVDSLWEVAASG